MTALTGSGRELTARFLFPEGFLGFEGHFPGKKILPGVCQVQCVLSMLEQQTGNSISLREIVLAKFFAPVLPNEEIVCRSSGVQESGEFLVKAVITRGDQKVSELKLKVYAVAQGTAAR